MHLFAVLGDPVRFRIIEILASGSHLAGEVTDAVVADLHISRSAVSHHLRILRNEGVVVVREDENRRQYRLRWNTLDRLDRILLDLYEGPYAATQEKNHPIYGVTALTRAHTALSPGGVLAVWAEDPDTSFPKRLEKAGFVASTHRAGKGGRSHVIYLGKR